MSKNVDGIALIVANDCVLNVLTLCVFGMFGVFYTKQWMKISTLIETLYLTKFACSTSQTIETSYLRVSGNKFLQICLYLSLGYTTKCLLMSQWASVKQFRNILTLPNAHLQFFLSMSPPKIKNTGSFGKRQPGWHGEGTRWRLPPLWLHPRFYGKLMF